MASSDIIAIVAIVISAIVTTVSITISYKMNKENIKSKLTEIAFDKRLEAYREIMEKIDVVSDSLIELTTLDKDNEIKQSNVYSQAIGSIDDFEKTLGKYRIYIVGDLDARIKEYRQLHSQLLGQWIKNNPDLEKLDEFNSKATKKANEIQRAIQKTLGIQ